MNLQNFLLIQEMVSHFWFLVHIFFCMKNIWPSSKNILDRDNRSFIGCIFKTGCRGQFLPFFLTIVLWISCFSINIFYIISFWTFNFLNETILTLTGVFIVLIAPIVTMFTVHLGSHFESYKEGTPLYFFKKQNCSIWMIHSAVVVSVYALAAICSYFILGKLGTVLVCGAIYIGILISSLVYYYFKYLRTKLFHSFQYVLSGKIKTLKEWGEFLCLSERKLRKYKNKLDIFLNVYGYKTIVMRGDQFYIKAEKN